MKDFFRLSQSTIYILLPLSLLGSTINSQADELRPSDNEKLALGISEFEGCPDNSLCTQKSGRLRSMWLSNLRDRSKNRFSRLEEFRRKYGIPFEVWTKGQAIPADDRIHFDSHCISHNEYDKTGANGPQKKFMISEVFAKDLNSVLNKDKKETSTLVRRGFLLKKKGKQETIVEYLIPRSDVPIYIQGSKLFYNREFEGQYYGMSLVPGGKVQIEAQVASPPYFPQRKECPESLLDKFKQHDIHQSLYAGSYCLQIPDINGRDNYTMILGWSCP